MKSNDLRRSPINGYLHPQDPGEPGQDGRPRLSVNDTEARICAEFSRYRYVLEIGTGLGVATLAMADTARFVQTVDIDPWVQTRVFPLLTVRHNVSCHSRLVEYDVPQFDLILIDGLHTYEQVGKDIRECQPMSEGRLCMWLFHDFNMPTVRTAIMDAGFAEVVPIQTRAGMAVCWYE